MLKFDSQIPRSAIKLTPLVFTELEQPKKTIALILILLNMCQKPRTQGQAFSIMTTKQIYTPIQKVKN